MVVQPDLGTTLLIAIGGFAVLVASAAPLAFVLGGGAIGGAVAVAAAMVSPYRWERVTSFLNLGADPLDTGYQAMQSLVALGTGGLFGVGLGSSRARWSFLPNAHTDFIFAIVGEETGLAGSLTVVLLFALLTAAGTMVALRCRDRFGRLVAIGITTWLAAQALVNIGGVTGVLPITGVPLPFVSYGGSALLTELIGVGILVGIARQAPSAGAGMTVAIAAAGTGGHVFPALAVAQALVARGLDPAEVVFLGGSRIEARVVPEAGFPFESIRTGGPAPQPVAAEPADPAGAAAHHRGPWPPPWSGTAPGWCWPWGAT